MIACKEITQTFKEVTALNNVSVNFEKGKITGLLGRNGAGKSTLLNIISNRIIPTAGEVIIDLEPAAENSRAQQKIFHMHSVQMYPENMKVKEAFYWANELYPNFDLEEAKRYADAFHLSMKQKIRKLSTGYQSIFMLISALASNAEYLLFDEPVLGLDVNNRDFFYRILLEKYAQNECGIIVSTHLIEEVEEILENIIIIHEGKILRNEPVEDLLKTVYQVSGPATLLSEFAKDKDVLHRHALGGLMTATIKGSFEGDLPKGLERSKVDLRQLFIELTGQYELEPVLNQQSEKAERKII